MSNSYTYLHPKPLGAKFAFFQLTFLMIACSLIIDSVNGFFLSGLGIDPKLSAAFKMILLIIILFQIGAYSQKVLAGVFSYLLILLIGPMITLSSTANVVGFIDDFISCLKTYTALIIFIYMVQVCHKWPCLVQKYGKWCLQLSFFVLVGNITLGAFGFGFSSYGSVDSDSSTAIGIKGFFFAGNEVSGLFVVLVGAFLHLTWQKSKVFYFVLAPFILLMGLLIATKAAMLSGAVLIFAIPLFCERNRLLNLTWLKVKMILPIIVVGIVLAFVLVPIFEATGLWDRFMWFYQKKGFVGIIFSGRDEFVLAALDAYSYNATFTNVIFGFSKTGLGMVTKNAMEIDPIDMYFWYGLSGVILFIVYATLFFRVSYLATLNKNSLWGSCVLLVNIILFGVSIIAGHVLISGMLAPFLGLINGMAYADLKNDSKV